MVARYCSEAGMKRLAALVAFLLLLGLATCSRTSGEGSPLQVSAAASLQDALQVVAQHYEEKNHEHVVFNFAGSNVLARQINAGTPADVFLSADLAQGNNVSALERRPLLTNLLVVVSNKPLTDFNDLKSLDRIAIGDPNAVPAGVYAKQFLQSNGLWEPLLPKLVPMDNVRAALAAVDRGTVDAAIVYRSDARMAKHATGGLWTDFGNITYPAVLRTPRGRRFYDYLFTDEAAKVFEAYGFGMARGKL